MKSKKYTSDDEKLYWAAFFHLGINGEKNLRRLIKKFGSLGEAWKNMFRRNGACPVSTEMRERIRNFSLDELKSDLEKHEIGLITLDSSEYPEKLKQIKNPPLVLYYMCRDGACPVSTGNALAVVGTRRSTVYAKQTLDYILPEIVQRKITIVSGLALGVDVYAHKLSLKNQGNTIAVLAGGLDQIYPPEHKNFAEEIIDSGGILLSEHPPKTSYLRQYFPARNRIISGLSDAVLVVEAQKKSGALITADFAFSQGRKVLAVPGSIFSQQSQGVNTLFKKGSLPVQSPEDILEIFYGRKRRKRNPVETGHPPTGRAGAPSLHNLNLTPEEKQIMEHIPKYEPISVNLIIRRSGLIPAQVIPLLIQLELKGLIENSESGYVKII